MEILQQLKKVTQCLDRVEDQVAATSRRSTPELSTDSFLQTIKSSKKQKKVKVFTDSSSDESCSDSPSFGSP